MTGQRVTNRHDGSDEFARKRGCLRVCGRGTATNLVDRINDPDDVFSKISDRRMGTRKADFWFPLLSALPRERRNLCWI